MKYLKKFDKVLLAIPLLLIGTMLVHADTNDSNLIKSKYDGYMAAYDAPDRIHMFWAERYTQNGTTAYCIEPLISITTETYSSTTDWGITELSADVRNYIRLVAYYGYDYSGHNTMKYYFAAQELIWEKIKGREVYWVEVEPIKWMIDERTNIALSKKLIFSAIMKMRSIPNQNGCSCH